MLIGAPPISTSDKKRGRRLFVNGDWDRRGVYRLAKLPGESGELDSVRDEESGTSRVVTDVDAHLVDDSVPDLDSGPDVVMKSSLPTQLVDRHRKLPVAAFRKVQVRIPSTSTPSVQVNRLCVQPFSKLTVIDGDVIA